GNDRSRSERDGWDDRSRSERDGWATVRSRRAWYRGSKRRMVGVTSQVQQVAGSVVHRGSGRGMVRNEPGSEQERVSINRTGRVWQQGSVLTGQ
ncbi:unnamed protein product, partial [Staurois parvus]